MHHSQRKIRQLKLGAIEEVVKRAKSVVNLYHVFLQNIIEFLYA